MMGTLCEGLANSVNRSKPGPARRKLDQSVGTLHNQHSNTSHTVRKCVGVSSIYKVVSLSSLIHVFLLYHYPTFYYVSFNNQLFILTVKVRE